VAVEKLRTVVIRMLRGCVAVFWVVVSNTCTVKL
jgi:hypothetical protein